MAETGIGPSMASGNHICPKKIRGFSQLKFTKLHKQLPQKLNPIIAIALLEIKTESPPNHLLKRYSFSPHVKSIQYPLPFIKIYLTTFTHNLTIGNTPFPIYYL